MSTNSPTGRTRRFLSIASTLALMTVAACSDDGTGAEGPDVSGSWSGVASFASGFSASMSINQTGTAVSGTMTVAGGFINAPATGTVDPTGRRLAWAVLDGCEAWAGTLDIDGTASSIEGPILIDRSGCGSGSNSSGVLRLDKS